MASVMHAVAAEGWLATESDRTEAELLRRFERELGDPRNAAWVLVDEGASVVGHAGVSPTRARGVFSLGMCVLPGSRGGGGGRALLAAIVDWAGSEDVHKLDLEVFSDNEAAMGLYESAGFEREGLRRDHYRRLDGTLRSAVIMALALPRS